MAETVQLTERTVRILGFPYMEEIESPTDPDKRVLIERVAGRGDTIQVRPADLKKGERFGAFEGTDTAPEVEGNQGAADTSDTDLINWIKGEQPSQEKPPTVPEVIDASNGDAEQAQRLLGAENAATGGDPRQGVVDGLNAVIQHAAQG